MKEIITKQLVCIVDDEKTNAEMLRLMLEDDYEICVAHSGEDALEVIKARRPDIVLLDIVLPELSGYDVCKLLKESPETEHIPVIFVTGLEDNHNEQFGLEVGGADYVTKPVSAAIVKARIHRVLETEMYIEFLENTVKSVSSQLSEIKERAAG